MPDKVEKNVFLFDISFTRDKKEDTDLTFKDITYYMKFMEHIFLCMAALVLQIISPVDLLKYSYSLIMSSFFLIKCQSNLSIMSIVPNVLF